MKICILYTFCPIKSLGRHEYLAYSLKTSLNILRDKNTRNVAVYE